MQRPGLQFIFQITNDRAPVTIFQHTMRASALVRVPGTGKSSAPGKLADSLEEFISPHGTGSTVSDIIVRKTTNNPAFNVVHPLKFAIRYE
jgi:hypothetical protein